MKRRNEGKRLGSVRRAKKYVKRKGMSTAGMSAFGKHRSGIRKSKSKVKRKAKRSANPLRVGKLTRVRVKRLRNGSIEIYGA